MNRIDVSLARTVATLTIDSFSEPVRKLGAAFPVGGGVARQFRIAVMAEHTSVGDPAGETGVIGPVITRTHRPVAAILRVPRDWKLYKFSRFPSADVAAGMKAGPEPVVDRRFEVIRGGAVETYLMPAQIRPAVTVGHGEEFCRGFVLKCACG